MRNKKPRRIMLFGHEITVSYKKSIKDPETGELLEGVFYTDPLRILIKNSDHWKQILDHEIDHAILFLSGQSETIAGNPEEGIVMAMEMGRASLLYID